MDQNPKNAILVKESLTYGNPHSHKTTHYELSCIKLLYENPLQ